MSNSDTIHKPNSQLRNNVKFKGKRRNSKGEANRLLIKKLSTDFKNISLGSCKESSERESESIIQSANLYGKSKT